MANIDIASLRSYQRDLRGAIYALQKSAFTAMGQPAGPSLAGPPPGGAPMDPSMMQGGAPMDPSMMQGGAPMDPNAMPPGGAPMDPSMMQGGAPMDPNAMPPGGAPMDPNAMPPGGAPPQGGAIPPELEQILTQLADGMGDMATTSEDQQAAIDQLGKQQLAMQKEMQELKAMLNGPLPTDAEAKDQAAAVPETTAGLEQPQTQVPAETSSAM